MAKNIKSQEYNDLGKGLNLFTRDTMLKENESVEGYNVWAVGKNSIAKRPGIVELCEIAGVDQIDGLGTYYNGATRELIAMAGGVAYTVHTGTAVALSAAPASANVFTTKKRTDWCQAGGKLFVANGTEPIRVYDGDAIRPQTGAIAGAYMIFYKGMLWAAGEPTAGNETRLYHSGTDTNIGNYTYHSTGNPAAGSVYVSQSDGQYLKGFFKHQDYLYPVKEKSLWRVSITMDTTSGVPTVSQEMIDPARGCDSHFSIDTVDNDNFMFNEQGVFATGYEPNILDQIRTNIVSLRVDPKIKAIEKSRLDDVVAMYFDNHYYLSYTSGGGGYNDTVLVYDRQRLGWWEFQYALGASFGGANCFSEYKNSSGETNLYFGSSVDGKIFYFDQNIKQDSGYVINTLWKSPAFSFGDLSQEKFYLDVELLFGKQTSNPTINVYVDGTLAATKTVAIGNTGAAGIGIESVGVPVLGVEGGTLDIADTGGNNFVRIPIGKLGRNIQVEVVEEDSTGTKTWELNALTFHYKPLSPLFQPDTL